jgi:cytochrome c oxidase subunit IV
MSKNEHAIHILPLRVYLGVGAALLVFTFITVYVSTFDFGEWNLVVAMVIAATKALLVAFFFMHLYYDSKVYFSIFIGALLFLAIFITFTMFDTQTRGQVNAEQENPIDPRAVIYRDTSATPSAKVGEPGKGPAVPGDSAKSIARPDSTHADTTSHATPAPQKK